MKTALRFVLQLGTLLGVTAGFGQNRLIDLDSNVSVRSRIIIDNDFAGDPDGLFQLVHHLLSPSVDIRGIIGSHVHKGGFYGTGETAAEAATVARDVLAILKLTGRVPVLEGAKSSLSDTKTFVDSPGADLIIKEAMRDDTKLPLYVVCGASLTNIASAYLKNPAISKRLKLIWIGGPEYSDLALPPPAYQSKEYNLSIDTKAAQVIFNASDVPLWQVPRDAYRQVLVSYAELLYKVKTQGKLGQYLVGKIEALIRKARRSLGEAYVIGDSPLVLLTALQSAWEADPASSRYVVKQAPKLNDSGLYEINHTGRIIRVYTQLDTRLMMEDFYAKLALYHRTAE